MSEELFMKIAQEATKEPLLSEVVFMLQNEPLFDKRIFKFIKYFKSQNKKKICSIITNGELIDEFDMEEIVQSNIDIFVISLNAHSERTFKLINKGIDYKRVLSNIELLLSNDTLRPKTIIKFVLTKQNKAEIPAAIRYWSKRGIKVEVKWLSNRAGLLNNYEEFKTNYRNLGFLRSLGYYLRLYFSKKIFKSCYWPFYQMPILFNGDVILCCHDWNRSPIVGNVKKNSLKEVWNSQELNKIRQFISENRYGTIDTCRECSIAKFYKIK